MLSYNIWTPEYNHMYGGIRALHQLSKEIKKRGYKATINSDSEKSIAIYPEIVKDNPFFSQYYVRWLLNEATFKDDVCYSWESEMGNHPLLTVNIIETNLWKKSKKKNGLVAYWVGKGIADYSVIPDGAIEINRQNFTERKELAKFISQIDYLISFDPFSAINMEATISETPVLMYIPEKQNVPYMMGHVDQTWSRKRIERQGWLKYGVAWNENELESAKENVCLQREHYLNLSKVFDKRIDSFIEQTQKLFG